VRPPFLWLVASPASLGYIYVTGHARAVEHSHLRDPSLTLSRPPHSHPYNAGRVIGGLEMRVQWSKAVALPPQPIYTIEMLPQAPSGYVQPPFAAGRGPKMRYAPPRRLSCGEAGFYRQVSASPH